MKYYFFPNPENDPFGVDLEPLLRDGYCYRYYRYAHTTFCSFSLEYSHAISVLETRLLVDMLCYVMISCTISHGVTFPLIQPRQRSY
jgi:hypothetical protein